MTKKFEEVLRGTAENVAALLQKRKLKGEIVLVVDRNRAPASDATLESELEKALQNQSVKDAATSVAKHLGLPRRQVYQAALKIGKSR